MESQTADAMTSDAAMKDNTAIVAKFQSLQQESDQLFDDLRHLPQFGQKIWQPYFGKAFSLFTKAKNNCALHDNTFCFIVLAALEVPTAAQVSNDTR